MKSFYEYRRKNIRVVLMQYRVLNPTRGRIGLPLLSYEMAHEHFNKEWIGKSYHQRIKTLSGEETIHDIRERFFLKKFVKDVDRILNN